jgi:hypothetical protein
MELNGENGKKSKIESRFGPNFSKLLFVVVTNDWASDGIFDDILEGV